MTMLGVLGEQLLLFALCLLIMQAALRSGRSQGLFAALPWGVMPALALALVAFWQFQQKDIPEIKAARQIYMTQADQLTAQAYPKPEDSALRDSFRALLGKFLEVVPAVQFSIHLVLLAALAVFLRRRFAQVGSMPSPEPLSRWTTPWYMAWLVLGPGVLLGARAKGLIEIETIWALLAWNVLIVGLAIFLFQGLLVIGVKLKTWIRKPNTRALVFLFLAGVIASLLIQDGRSLLAFLILTGLFEPWVDARRLRQPPPAPNLKS